MDLISRHQIWEKIFFPPSGGERSEKNKKCRGQKGKSVKGKESSRHSHSHHAKTNIEVTKRAREPKAIGRTANPSEADPTTATQQLCVIIATIQPRSTVYGRALVATIIYILTPFPYITMHIV